MRQGTFWERYSDTAIKEARDGGGIKRAVKSEELYDLRLMQRVNGELQGWWP